MKRGTFLAFLSVASLGVGLSGCSESASPRLSEDPDAEAPPTYDRVARVRFNQLAVRLNLPLFWVTDSDHDQAIDPSEVAALLFYPTVGHWVADDTFTAEFKDAYERIATLDKGPPVPESVPADDRSRREAVVAELDQACPSVVLNDLSALTTEEKRFLSLMLEVGALIDKLYARTLGIAALADQVPADDVASQSLFRRNWGPKCVYKPTSRNPVCSAIPGAPKPKIDVYPSALVDDQGDFCKTLRARSDAVTLLTPFTVVRGEGDAFAALAYSQAYADEMTAIAAKLDEAAGAISDPSEAALAAYLVAAAQAFRDNSWELADEPWSRMSSTNSKWYIRVAPDEVYWDPCDHKAAFHMNLARINLDSLSWQDRLAPLRQEMEDRLAVLAGAPYVARTVNFHLPDFINVIANYGYDRSPTGGFAGESLPNWGPVASEGRGRTMVVTNLEADPDSGASRESLAQSLFTADTLGDFTSFAQAYLLTTILHEATHNLGPGLAYRIGDLTADLIFGGLQASVLEELKAETGALWYLPLLVEKGVITPKQARDAYLYNVMFALAFIAGGTNSKDAYVQLSAIEAGFLVDEGALRFDPQAMAANGTDQGAFVIDYDKLPGAAEKLMQIAASIKAKGDVQAAQALATKYVDTTALPIPVLAERSQRGAGVNIVYSVKY